MSSFEFGFPDVAFSRNDKDKYEWLKDSEKSPFYGYTMADIFIFAMSYAFNKKLKPKQLEDPQKNMPQDAFKPEMRNLMRAVAIASRDIDVIKDHSSVVKICEQYANAGLSELYDMIFQQLKDREGKDILDELIRNAETARAQV